VLARALFDVAGNYLSIEASPIAEFGFYFASISLGGLAGSLISGVAILYSFQTLFIASGVLFAISLITSLKVPETWCEMKLGRG
jgi:dipeptide/tripeptide permease